jgi:hypothetical protein
MRDKHLAEVFGKAVPKNVPPECSNTRALFGEAHIQHGDQNITSAPATHSRQLRGFTR